MKAIKITQDLKDKNTRYETLISKTDIGDWHKGIPNKFYNTEPVSGGYKTRTDLHDADGFLEIIIPSIDRKTEKMGTEIIEVNGHPTYEVIAKSEEEIEVEVLGSVESTKETLILTRMRGQVEAEAQLMDDTEAQANQGLYPVWTYPFYYELGYKCQHLNNDNEVVLYKCIQAHESQEGWKPKDVPALFIRVAEEGQILDWVQPLGAHDAYQTGDKVNHNGQVWISIVDNNVWEPSVYGWEIFTQ